MAKSVDKIMGRFSDTIRELDNRQLQMSTDIDRGIKEIADIEERINKAAAERDRALGMISNLKGLIEV